MPGLGSQATDTTRVYRLTLSGSGLTPSLAGHFDGTEDFTATLSPGESYAPVATLSAAWATLDVNGQAIPTNPASFERPELLLTISRAAIEDVSPGTYQVRIVADAGTVDEPIWSGPIELTASAGVGEVPRTYCTYGDVTWEVPWIGLVEATADSRAQSFLPERDAASRWVEELALARWDRDSDLGKRLVGPSWGLSQPWATGSALSVAGPDSARSDFQTLLSTTGVMPDADGARGPLRRAVALKAASLALEDQVGHMPNDENTSLQSEAARLLIKAGLMIGRTDLYVDSDDDGIANYWLAP